MSEIHAQLIETIQIGPFATAVEKLTTAPQWQARQ